MKHILNLFIFILLTSVGLQSLHAGESSSKGASLFTDTLEEEEFLSPDVAFKLDVVQKDSSSLSANFKIEPGYYLYKERIKFVLAPGSSAKIANISLPKGDIKDDPNFGKQEVYHHDFSANILLSNASGDVKISARYQGCSEKGLCYAPQTKDFNVNINEASPATNTGAASSGAVLPSGISSDDDKTTSALKSGNLWLVIAAFFGAGLVLSFLPCNYPMYPILSSIIVGSQAKKIRPSKLHAFGLSVAYVLGMAIPYTIAGIAAALSGSLINQSLQNPWVLGATALLFVALAFSMFGFYELKMPAALENKVLNTSQKFKGGEFFGVFIMGAISALIISPCVSAPLAGLLVIIGKNGDVFLGAVGLFTLAIGMGFPLLLIGASAGSLLPKAGSWMTAIRNFCGVIMLAIAAYIIWPILPNAITQPVDKIVNKALGLQAIPHLPFSRVKSVAELDAAIANANGKTVMLDFYADWCTSCKEMEKFTFSNENVIAALQDTVLLQADVTDNNDDDQALLKRFNLFGPPGIIFFDKTGAEQKIRVIGYKNVTEFTQVLNQVQGKVTQ